MRFLLLSLAVAAIAALAGHAEAGVEQNAMDAADSVIDRMDSGAEFQNNVSNPITTDHTLMRTIDGVTSFDAHLTCPSSQKFLDVFVTVGPTGDLSSVVIGEDLDMDGVTDYSTQLPFPVSGICANGVISCTPGTWSGCSYYKWAAGQDLSVSVETAGATELGGCYCVNSECGNNLVYSNLPIVLQDLGGGIAGTIQRADPLYTVTEASIEGSLISYYGQKSGDCSGTGASSDAVGYYDNPLNLEGDAQNKAMADASDPDSMTSLMNDAVENQGGAELVSCNVDRIVSVNTVTDSRTFSDAGNGAASLCVDAYAFERIYREIDESTGTIEYHYQLLDTNPNRTVAHNNCGGAGSGGGPGDWHDVAGTTFSLPPYPPDTQVAVINDLRFCTLATTYGYSTLSIDAYCTSDCSYDRSDNYVCSYDCPEECLLFNMGFTGRALHCPVCTTSLSAIDGRGVLTTINDSSSGAHTWNLDLWYEATTTIEARYDELVEGIDDSCRPFENDQDCTLRAEEVDGVVTMTRSNPTGLVPEPSCRTFTGETTIFDECRDWWTKERTYACRRNDQFDFSDAKTRTDAISGSVDLSGSTMYYTDQRRDGQGAWMTEANTADLGDLGSYAACAQACKTVTEEIDSQVSGGTTKAEYQTSDTTLTYHYRECTFDGQCPVEPGETIVKDCQCIDDFMEAAGLMGVLDAASGDLICSDGVAK